MTRRTAVVAFVAAGLLLTGCVREVTGSAAPPVPAPAVPTSSAPAPAAARTSTPPAAPSATASVPSRPDLASVRSCKGCAVRGVRHGVRPGVSVALLVGRDTEVLQRAVLVAYRTTTGAILGQRIVPDGEFLEDLDAPPAPPVCDRLAHCFVPAAAGAHGGTLAAFAIGPAGSVTLLTSLFASHPTFTTPDLDGDGVRELVAVQSDCDPACADGNRFWQVHRWSAGRYLVAGCAPYREEARPPARLSAAACRP